MNPSFASGPEWVGRVPPYLLDEISRIAGHLAAHPWTEAGAGNLSILLPEGVRPQLAATPGLAEPHSQALPLAALGGRSMLVTLTGSRMRDIAAFPPDGLALTELDPAAETLWVTGGRPTSELDSHLAVHAVILETHQTAGAIVHTHPPSLITLSHLGQQGPALKRCGAPPLQACAPPHLAGFLGSITPEAAVLLSERMTVLPPEDPGGRALARRSAEAARKYQVIVWPYHGVIAWGADLAEALDLIECAEKAAEIAVRMLPWIAATTAPAARRAD